MGGMDGAYDGSGSERDPFDLDRFVRAQDTGDTYVIALGELRDGRKRSHWMWFVFPQVGGLGPQRGRSTSRSAARTRRAPTSPTRCSARGCSSARGRWRGCRATTRSRCSEGWTPPSCAPP